MLLAVRQHLPFDASLLLFNLSISTVGQDQSMFPHLRQMPDGSTRVSGDIHSDY